MMIANWLATPRGTRWNHAADRHFAAGAVGFLAVMTLAGFLPDWTRYRAEVPSPPLILDLHGAAYSLWLVLVGVQIGFVERHRTDLHRWLGWWLVGLTALMVPLGLVAAMVDMARQQGHADYAPEFLGLEFQSMVVLGALIAGTALLRRDPAAHRRLAVAMAVDLMDPGASRAFGFFSPWKPGGPGGWWLNYFWANALLLAAMIGWDLWRHRRVHPALIGAGLLLAGGEALAVWLQFSPCWHGAMVALVRGWGWTG